MHFPLNINQNAKGSKKWKRVFSWYFQWKTFNLLRFCRILRGQKTFINFQFHQFHRERQSFPWPLVDYNLPWRHKFPSVIFSEYLKTDLPVFIGIVSKLVIVWCTNERLSKRSSRKITQLLSKSAYSIIDDTSCTQEH